MTKCSAKLVIQLTHDVGVGPVDGEEEFLPASDLVDYFLVHGSEGYDVVVAAVGLRDAGDAETGEEGRQERLGVLWDHSLDPEALGVGVEAGVLANLVAWSEIEE